MNGKNLPDFSIEDIVNSLDTIFDEKQESKDNVTEAKEKKARKEKELWELLPKKRVTANTKCYLRSEGIEVEVWVEFKVESIEGNEVILSSPNFVFVWRCLQVGKELFLLSEDGKYLIRGKIRNINLRKETLSVSLEGKPMKYLRQLFRVEVNPQKPIYLVMKVENEPIVAVVNDINEDACSFTYKPLPILPGDIFGIVLRFPDGKKLAIPDSELITVRKKSNGLRTYVVKIRVPESEKAYLRKFLIERQREILEKLKRM